MKKIFNVLLAGICLASACAVGVSAAAITTTDATAGKVAAAPTIDGVYDPAEGWGDPIVTITDPDTSYLGLCATDNPELLTDKNLIPSETKVYFRWDDTNFYYCATLVQQQRFNNYDWSQAGAIWQGDSVSYNIKSTLDNDSKTRCLFALTAEDGLVYCEESFEDMTAGISSYDNWKIGRDEDTKVTTYEIYFSWEDVIPSGEMKAGDVFYFRDLYMPAINETFKNPVDVNTAGITASGSYNYWKITLAEDGTAAAEAVTETAAPAEAAEFTTYTEYPEMPGTELLYATGDMDMMTGYDAKGGIGVDLFNLASGGTSFCLKRDTSAWYDFEVSEKTDVTFYVGYIARDGSNRALDYAVDGGARVFMDIPESAEQQWVSATFTVDAGKHTFYLYAPTGMDDSTLKSCDVYTIELYGNPAAVEEAPAAEVVEEAPVAEEVVEETPVVEETVEEAPAAEEVAEEVPAPVVEEVVEEVPAAEEIVEEPAVEEVVEEAPQTFDFGVIAAVIALFSAAGYALTKKR